MRKVPKNTTRRNERLHQGVVIPQLLRALSRLPDPKTPLRRRVTLREQKKATYNRAKNEYLKLMEKIILTKRNKNRMKILGNIMNKFGRRKPSDITSMMVAETVHKYLPDVSVEDVDKIYLEHGVNKSENMSRKTERLRALLRDTMAEIEKQPQTLETRKDYELMQDTMDWFNPTGLPAGYGTRNISSANRAAAESRDKSPAIEMRMYGPNRPFVKDGGGRSKTRKQRGGGCGCGGAASQPLLPTA